MCVCVCVCELCIFLCEGLILSHASSGACVLNIILLVCVSVYPCLDAEGICSPLCIMWLSVIDGHNLFAVLPVAMFYSRGAPDWDAGQTIGSASLPQSVAGKSRSRQDSVLVQYNTQCVYSVVGPCIKCYTVYYHLIYICTRSVFSPWFLCCVLV